LVCPLPLADDRRRNHGRLENQSSNICFGEPDAFPDTSPSLPSVVWLRFCSQKIRRCFARSRSHGRAKAGVRPPRQQLTDFSNRLTCGASGRFPRPPSSEPHRIRYTIVRGGGAVPRFVGCVNRSGAWIPFAPFMGYCQYGLVE